MKISHNTLKLCAIKLVAPLSLIGILLSSQGCLKLGGGGGGLITSEALATYINLSGDPQTTAQFTIGSQVLSSGAVAYGSRSCWRSITAADGNLGKLMVNSSPSGTADFTDGSDAIISGQDHAFVYMSYGPKTSMKALSFDLLAGTGSFHDIWVADMSTLDVANYQVTIIDKTANQSNQVSPVAGVDGTRLQLEGDLIFGHNYTVTFSNNVGVVYSVDFAAPTSAATEFTTLITLSDKLDNSGAEIKAFGMDHTGQTCTQ